MNKRNEILAKLADVDVSSANQVYSDIRALKVDLTFAIGGIKNHEIYFEHLGGGGGDPDGTVGAPRSSATSARVEAWRADLKATGMAGRGWAWTAYDWDEERALQLHRRCSEHVPDLERDAARRARRLRARVLPRLPDRPRLLHRRVLQQSRLGVINGWVSKYQIQA